MKKYLLAKQIMIVFLTQLIVERVKIVQPIICLACSNAALLTANQTTGKCQAVKTTVYRSSHVWNEHPTITHTHT